MGIFKDINTKTYDCYCFKIKGKLIERWARFIFKTIKSVIARTLYGLYTILAIWRVTEATQITQYWFLLLALIPLALETLHTIFFKWNKTHKWITPSVLFFLLVAIPCVWLLELELLNDRLTEAGSSENEEGSLTNFTNENWALALEQMLIFVLVFSKWIAPKGQMTHQEMSQLLLVTIAAGADILELLETFGESNVNTTRETVYLVLAVWSWSLLQFCFILTTAKQVPVLLDDIQFEEAITKDLQQKHKKPKHLEVRNGVHSKSNAVANGNGIANGGVKHDRQPLASTSKDMQRAVDRFESELEAQRTIEGRRCFECFCCYNEIWGMTLQMMFQDGPFLITRLVILFHYKVFTHMNIFFTLKNIIVILLLLNHIRVVAKEGRTEWKEQMVKVRKMRKDQEEEKRQRLMLPKKKVKPGKKESQNDNIFDD